MPVKGPDYFQWTLGPQKRPCSTCPLGHDVKMKLDVHGQEEHEDWCVRLIPAVTAATVTPLCSPGFTWNGEICTRAGAPAHSEGIERCRGNWLPIDNTDNWTYHAEQGPDLFKKNNGAAERPCTKCPNGGSIHQDFQGQQDWCVKPVPAVPPATAPGSCPSGFTLQPI